MDSTKEARSPRRRRSRLLWIGLALAVAAGLALGAGLFPQEPVRRMAEAALRRAIGPQSRIGRLRVVPARLRVEFQALRLSGPGYLVEIPRGSATLAPRALIGRTASFRRLELDSPQVSLDLAVKGETPSRSPLAALGLLQVDEVAIRGARHVLRTSDGASLTVSGLSAHGTFGAGRLEVAAPELVWRGERTLRLGPAIVRLDTAPGLDATLAGSALELGRSRIGAEGSVVRSGALRPELRIEGRLDLADLGARLGIESLSGALALQGRLDGVAGRLRAEGRLDGDAGLRGWRVEGLRLDGRHDAAEGSTRITLSGRAHGGTLEGTAQVEGTRTRGLVAAKGVELARLPGRAAGGLSGPADVDLAWDGPLGGTLRVEAHARADARTTALHARLSAAGQGRARRGPRALDLDLEWQAELSGEAPAAGRAELRLSAQGTALGPFPPRVSAELHGEVSAAGTGRRVGLDVSGRFEASREQLTASLEARGGATVLTAQAALDGERLTRLSARAERVDLGAFVPGASGSAAFEVEGAGALARPSLSLLASAEAVVWRGAKLGAVRAHASGDTSKLDLELRLPDLAARAAGELRLGAESRLRGRAWLETSPLAPLAPLLVPSGGPALSGHVSATAEYDLDPRRPADARLTADVAEIEARSGEEGHSLRAGPFRATLRGARLGIEGLEAEGPGLRLSAGGSAGIGRRDSLDLRARVELQLATLPLPKNWSLAGTADADLVLGGSRERPTLDGALRLRDVSARTLGLPELHVERAEAALAGDRVSLAGVEARVGEGTAQLSGVIPFAALLPALRRGPLAASEEARLTLHWDGVHVDHLGGALTGQLTVEGGLASLREPRARLELPATRLSLEGQPFETLATTLHLERGRLATEQLTLRGQGGDFVVSGFADLVAHTIDVVGHGSLDLRALSPLLTEAALRGTAEVDVAVAGPLASPRPRGSLRVRDGSLRLRALPQALTAITGGVELTAEGARIDASGVLGGGSLRVSGDLAATGRALGDARLTFTGRDIALAYPVGMRARLDTDLTLSGRPGSLTLAGDVVVQRGVYELDVALRQALAASRVARQESDLLRAIGLDVRMRVARSLVVRSGLGRVEVVGHLVARGDLQEPLPFGRLQLRPGGRLDLQGRSFTVSDGALTYAGDWNPEISLKADARIRESSTGGRDGSGQGLSEEYHVTVSADGTLEEPRLAFSSEPTLSQPAIVSLVATGSRTGPLVDTSAWLVGGQAGSLLADRLTLGMARSFGLDQLTVRPDLIAGETDPSARFTLGKDLGRRLGVIYSIGLGAPETRFIQVEARPGYDLVTRLQRTDAGTYNLDVGQRFRWGEAEGAARVRGGRTRLEAVRLLGSDLPDGLREELRLAAGRRTSAWRVQEEAERLREWLRARLYLAAEVTARLEGTTAVVSVSAGPQYGWRVEGLAAPPDLGSIVRDALFDEEALERGRDHLLRRLHGEGHWRARVETSVETEGRKQTLVFRVVPGPRYSNVVVRFEGTQLLAQGELLEAAGGIARLLENPQAAVEAVGKAYHARHYLAARIGTPRIEERGDRLRIDVAVDEGEEARLAGVRFEGASLPEAELKKATRLETGLPFTDTAIAKAAASVRALYRSRGWADARLRPQLVREANDLLLVLHVTEGERHEIEQIVLAGNTRTREDLVRRTLGLRTGAPLDPRRLARAEQRLMNLGTFSRVAVVPRPESPSTLDVQLTEGALVTAAYDLRWNQDEKLSAFVQGELRNVLGTGLALGGRQRIGGDTRETRGWLHLPVLVAGGDLTGSVFRLEQDRGDGVTRLERGFQLQHTLRLGGDFELYGGYRFRRNTVIALDQSGVPIDVAGVDLSLVRTTRDNLLDPLEGHFLSVNLEIDPRRLGSDAPFVKGFAQLALTHSFAKRSLTWAQRLQLGLARAAGGEPLLPSERFLAGGANSLRGFATNQVGPPEAAGGEAVLIFNQELRYRHRSGLGAAVFYDAGNVFPQTRDLGLELRHALGAGLRWASPVGLLRLDLGFPVDRHPKEKRYQLFFSLGQAF